MSSPALVTPEVCLCAAIQMPDGYIIRGHRHNDCLRVAAGLRVPTGVHPHDYVRRYSAQQVRAALQGFLTTRERFVTREAGADLQFKADRTSVRSERNSFPDVLYSEDLY